MKIGPLDCVNGSRQVSTATGSRAVKTPQRKRMKLKQGKRQETAARRRVASHDNLKRALAQRTRKPFAIHLALIPLL